jgi:hypothetical protein
MPFIVNDQGEVWDVSDDSDALESIYGVPDGSESETDGNQDESRGRANRPSAGSAEKGPLGTDDVDGGNAVGSADQSRSSAAQIRANRENAQKSTGPTSKAGKERSSRNAIKHGIFSARVEPVVDGSMMEDPGEFEERVRLLVASMNPTDPVEVELATRMAGVLIDLGRNDIWGARCIKGVSIMTAEDIEAGARTEVQVRCDIGANRMLADHLREPSLTEDPALSFLFPKPSLTEDPVYSVLAFAIWKYGPRPHLRIKGLWDDDNTPSTPAQWRAAYETLKKHSWKNDDDARIWVRRVIAELERRLESVEDLEERIAANRIYHGPFDLKIKYEARLLNNLRALRTEYEGVQKRNQLRRENEKRIEERRQIEEREKTNPI